MGESETEKVKQRAEKDMKTIPVSAGLAAFIVFLVCAGSTIATTITAEIGGSAKSGVNYVTFDSLSSGSTAAYFSGVLAVSFVPNAQAGGGSAPILSGNNDLNFGSLYDGSDSTMWLTAGNNTNAWSTRHLP